jgi:hypothetical protein
MKPVAVLHIGKTAGTALKAVLDAQKNIDSLFPVEIFSHEMTLPRLCGERPDHQVIFFVRDPLSRFVSAFNSRLRRGQPRYNSQWTKAEEVAFSHFSTANQLAEALAKQEPRAISAMAAISHIRQTLVYFLGSIELLERERDRILFIGEQERFDADLAMLRELLRVNPSIITPTDDIGAHRNPSHMQRELSDMAARAVTAWYDEDYRILEWCRTFRR